MMNIKFCKPWFRVLLILPAVLPSGIQAAPEDEALAALKASIGMVLTAETEFGVVAGSDAVGESWSIFGKAKASIGGNPVSLDLGVADAPGIVVSKPLGKDSWELVSLDASLSETITLAGLSLKTINGGLSVAYDPRQGALTLHGGVEASFESESIELRLGNAAQPGLSLSIREDGSCELLALSGELSADLDLFGVKLSLDPNNSPTLRYKAANNHYAASGALSLAIENQKVGIRLGDEKDPGLVISGGVLEHLEFAIVEDLTFAGLELKTGADGVGAAYDRDGGQLIVSGSATIEIEGEIVTVALGDDQTPGMRLTIDEGTGTTTLAELALSVADDLNIAGFTFDVPDADPIDIRYTEAPDGDHFLVSGEVKLKDLWSADLALGSAQHPGLKIVDGTWDLESLSIDLQQIDLGFVTMKEVKVRFAEDEAGPDVEVDLSVVIPEIGEIAADVKVRNGALEEIALEYDALGDSEGLEIAETGISIAELGVDLTNLDQPADLGFEGTVGLEFGGQLDLFGETVTLIRVNGDVAIDRNHFYMEDQFLLGAYRPDSPDHAPWKSVLFDGDLIVDLNWSEDRYFLKGEVKIPEDYGLYLDAELLINQRVLDALIKAGVRVPMEIPVIGGIWLDQIDVALRMDHADPSADFAAAWTEILFWRAGIEYEWNRNEFKLLDGAAIDQIQEQISDDENTRTLTKTFTLPYGADAMSLHLDWGQTIELAQIDVFGPVELHGNPATFLLDLEPLEFSDTGIVVDAAPFEAVIVNESSVKFFVRQGDSLITGDGTSPPLASTASESARQVILQFTYDKALAPNLTASDLKVEVVGHYPGSSINATFSDSANSAGREPRKPLLGPMKRDAPVKHAGSSLPIDLEYWMLGLHAGEAEISLYLDDDDKGHDGRLVVSGLPYGGHDEIAGGAQSFPWTVAGHIPHPHGSYHLYARLDRPGRSPVYSPHLGPFHIAPPLHGTVTDPLRAGLPLPGTRVFLDENFDGRFDPLTEPSVLTNPDGEFAFHSLPEGTHRLGLLPLPGHDFRGDLGGEPTVMKDFVHRIGEPTEVNFHLALRRSVSGIVFIDANGNGARDEAEAGMPGVVLYHDLDGDGIRSAGEARAMSKADGSYRFHALVGETWHRFRILARPELATRLEGATPALTTGSAPYAQHAGQDVAIPPDLAFELGNPDYSEWAARTLAASPASGPFEDPDGDGIPNFTEFLGATDPFNSNDAPALAISRSGDLMTLDFEARQGVRYRLESSEDLRNWEVFRDVRDAEGPIKIQPNELPDVSRTFYRLDLDR